MKKVFLNSIGALACMIFMTGCGKDDPNTEVALTDITVTTSPSPLNLTVGGIGTIQAKAVPENATGVQFSWTSANPAIATVTNGTVTAVSVGETTVTVSSGSISKSVPVTVAAEVIALDDIRLSRESVVKPVDDTAKVVATPVPSNATDVVLEWTSADPEVATVDQTGIITITGVGTTTVTVTAVGKGKSKTVAVEGTIKSISVQNASGTGSGQHPVGSIFRLTAVVDPENTGVDITWSSNDVTIATVDANGEVTVVGSGAASIIASVGDIRGEYSFSTASLFDEAKGYWTFDDPNNPGKAIKGEDLEINFDVVTEVPGMDASDGAIRGGWEERGVGEEHIKNVTWNHTMEGQLGDDGKTIRNYTVLVDLKLLYQDDLSSAPRQVWAPIHWGENNMGGLACIYVAWADYSAEPDRGIGLRLAWNLTGTWQYFTPKDKEDGSPWFDKTTLKDNEPWFRFVYTFRYSVDDPGMNCNAYYNGEPAFEPSSGYGNDQNWFRTELKEGVPIHFMTQRKADKSFKGQYDLTKLAVWDRTLTLEEVRSLGTVGQ